MTQSKKKTTKTHKISKKIFTNTDEYGKINKRIYTQDVFIPMYITCQPTKCFTQWDIKQIFNKDYDFGERFDHTKNIDYTTKYFIHMNSLLKAKTIPDTEHQNTLYNLIVSIYSQYMEHFFKLSNNNNSQFICNVNYNVPYSKISTLEQKLIVSIYKINIELKDDPTQKFTLIYGTYDYQHYNNTTKKIEEEKKSYKIILNLIPFESKINQYGLYENYISSGIYVYKIFEYNNQTDYTNKIPEQYTFIGDLLTNMWPLQILKEHS